jgi:hypothetical protein
VAWNESRSGLGLGKVTARLATLTIPEKAASGMADLMEEKNATTQMPALDIVAEQFELSGRKLGRLELAANNVRTDTWREWRALFDLAHIGVAARPGYSVTEAALPLAVATEFQQRQGRQQQLRNTPSGHAYLAQTLDVDISATQIRAALQRGEQANSLIPAVVLDYIQQHNLYKT